VSPEELARLMDRPHIGPDEPPALLVVRMMNAADHMGEIKLERHVHAYHEPIDAQLQALAARVLRLEEER